MIKKNLKIIDYGYSGEGVAKYEGKVFFVPKTLVGEQVTISVLKENSSFYWCKLENVITPSKQRISSLCPYFNRCGGCNFHHTSYQNELEIKKQLFIKEFSKVKSINDVDIESCSHPLKYRNKIRFKVKQKSLGFYEEKTNSFVKIDRCLLCSDIMNLAISQINEFLQNSEWVFDEVVIYSFMDQIIIDFISMHNVDVQKIKQYFPYPLMINHIGEVLSYEYLGINCSFEGDAFRQVNDEIASKLYSETIDEVVGKRIINAYSGAGLLSALLAKKADKVYGIELNKSAHRSAEKLKNKNNITNLVNICGYAETEIGKIIDQIDCVVLDPPRAGCDKIGLKAIIEKKVPKIIYVSCNPATLVRDLKNLAPYYEISKVKLFDMFPRTANVESLVVLTKKI